MKELKLTDVEDTSHTIRCHHKLEEIEVHVTGKDGISKLFETYELTTA